MDKLQHKLKQLCPTRGPVEGFVRPSLGFCCSKSTLQLTTCPCYDNLEFDIFGAVVPQVIQCAALNNMSFNVRPWSS